MNKVLIIIDLQVSFSPSNDLVARINEIARNYSTVIATQFVNGNELFQTVLQYPKLSESECKLVSLPESIKVFKKTGYGLPVDLITLLKSNSVVEVDICGLETDACVLASMYNLWDAGIQPHLLKEVTVTRDQELQNASCVILQRNFRV